MVKRLKQFFREQYLLLRPLILTLLVDLIFINFSDFIHTDVHVDHFASRRGTALLLPQRKLIVSTLNHLKVVLGELLPSVIAEAVYLLSTTASA